MKSLARRSKYERTPVVSISESSYTPVSYAERAMAFAADGGVPIEAGTETVQISLQVTWALQTPAD